MNAETFNRRVAALGLTSKALPAARAVLCEDRSLRGAARDYGVDPGNVHRLVTWIRDARFCPECGQPTS